MGTRRPEGEPVTERNSSMEELRRLVADLTAAEGRETGGQSGALRAAIFGINDGLVSNFSLVMGVAGAAPGAGFVLLAGMAGLLAGAFSMAAGEYVSMSSQRELFENQIATERRKHEKIRRESGEGWPSCARVGASRRRRRGPWRRP